MAKIGCLKPFRGLYDDIKDIVLEDGELVLDKTNYRTYVGDGTHAVGNLMPWTIGQITESVVSRTVNTEYLHENSNVTAIRYGYLAILNIDFSVIKEIPIWTALFTNMALSTRPWTQPVGIPVFTNNWYINYNYTWSIYMNGNSIFSSGGSPIPIGDYKARVVIFTNSIDYIDQ